MNSSISAPTSPQNPIAGTTTTAAATITPTAGHNRGAITLTPPSASASASASPSASATGLGGAATVSRKPLRPAVSSAGSAKNAPSLSPRVVFGAGAISHLPTELGRLRASSPLIISSPSCISLARQVQTLIPNLGSTILDSALINVPQRVVDDALGRVSGRDCVISVGGSSAVKLAKSIAVRNKIPHICVPTAYSGSEMSLQGGARRRGKDRQNGSRPSRRHSADMDTHTLPTIVIYDENLTSNTISTTISVPMDVGPSPESRRHRASDDEDAQWSYIHLPGV